MLMFPVRESIIKPSQGVSLVQTSFERKQLRRPRCPRHAMVKSPADVESMDFFQILERRDLVLQKLPLRLEIPHVLDLLRNLLVTGTRRCINVSKGRCFRIPPLSNTLPRVENLLA